MKTLLIILTLFTSTLICQAQSSIHYYVTNEKSFEDQELKAIVGEKIFVLIGKEENLYLSIEKVEDFNKDGYLFLKRLRYEKFR